jgi:predicted metal-binding membrane protein
LKRWCLRHCRSPIGHLIHYAAYRGRSRDLRAGLHHGLLCIGCCWMLMVALIVVGVMNVAAMLVLTALIVLEKRWRFGEQLAKFAGAAAIALAVAVAFQPSLAPGLHHSGDPSVMDDMSDMDM